MKNQVLPELPPKFYYRLDLRHHVTPRLLRQLPIHDWFVFPHSYSPQLIDEVLCTYSLPKDGTVLDPFVGAGTTILWAKQNGISGIGTDLSPLSVFVSKAKITPYDLHHIEENFKELNANKTFSINLENYPDRIKKAFSQNELAIFEGIRKQINNLDNEIESFFTLALLNVQQRLSRAVPDGGWFRWVEKEDQSDKIAKLFKKQVRKQISDLILQPAHKVSNLSVYLLDARMIDELHQKYDAIITSPPYPNRHDYSRIFHLELLSLGESEQDIFRFRHSSIRSHVEARNPNIPIGNYSIPPTLQETLDRIPEKADPRITSMLKGYFEDMYLCLKSAYGCLKSNAICAFVVGNVKHAGVMVPVDIILSEVAEQVGYVFDCAWVARLRGNSAQQMAIYKREPSRETIVFLKSK